MQYLIGHKFVGKYFLRKKFSSPRKNFVNFVRRIFLFDEFLSKILVRGKSCYLAFWTKKHFLQEALDEIRVWYLWSRHLQKTYWQFKTLCKRIYQIRDMKVFKVIYIRNLWSVLAKLAISQNGAKANYPKSINVKQYLLLVTA